MRWRSVALLLYSEFIGTPYPHRPESAASCQKASTADGLRPAALSLSRQPFRTGQQIADWRRVLQHCLRRQGTNPPRSGSRQRWASIVPFSRYSSYSDLRENRRFRPLEESLLSVGGQREG